jgi:hypothetical protein
MFKLVLVNTTQLQLMPAPLNIVRDDESASHQLSCIWINIGIHMSCAMADLNNGCLLTSSTAPAATPLKTHAPNFTSDPAAT